MGIQIENAIVKPSVVYNRIHMTKLEIVQPTQANDAATPKYEVIIFYRHYGVVEGVRYYKDEELNVVSIGGIVSESKLIKSKRPYDTITEMVSSLDR